MKLFKYALLLVVVVVSLSVVAADTGCLTGYSVLFKVNNGNWVSQNSLQCVSPGDIICMRVIDATYEKPSCTPINFVGIDGMGRHELTFKWFAPGANNPAQTHTIEGKYDGSSYYEDCFTVPILHPCVDGDWRVNIKQTGSSEDIFFPVCCGIEFSFASFIILAIAGVYFMMRKNN
ncbi:MAG: hypothetical protein KK926_05910 [Methanomethylovorans sp.]|nr:hypothetical protein [Methanomethylovorans sp.]